MPRYVALFRGLNVGQGNRIAMADLRAVASALGFEDVTTLLASGNLLFTAPGRSAPKHAAAIRKALAEAHDIDTPVHVRGESELRAIAAENPLADDPVDPARLLVVFPEDAEALAAVAALAPLAKAPERLEVGRLAAYLACPGGQLESAVAKELLGRTGRRTTTRNWKTVRRILDALDG